MSKRDLIQIFLIAASWGFAVIFIKLIASSGMHPLAIATMRSALSLVAFGVWFGIQKRNLVYDRTMVRHMMVLGILNGLIPNAMIAVALARIGSAPAAMIQASIPAMVALLAGIFLPIEKLKQSQLFGFVVSFFGVLVIVGHKNVLEGNATLLGTVAMLTAALSYAFATLYLRLAKPTDPYSAALGQQFFSLVGALFLCTLVGIPLLQNYSMQTWATLAGLAVVATAVPTVLYFKLIEKIAATKASLVQYLLPLMSSIYAVVFLGETIEPRLLFGGCIILLGVWLAINNAERKR